MINSGDKFIIEIEAVYGRADGGSAGSVPTLYRAKGFRSLVFDVDGLKKLVPLDQMRPSWWEEIYQRGLDEAWGLAERLAWKSSINDLVNMGFLRNKSVTNYPSYVLGHFTASEALAKIREYEEKKKAEDEAIKVGDEVVSEEAHVVVTWIDGDKWNGVLLNDCENGESGHCYTCMKSFSGWRKTGRHFPQIAEVLGEIANNE